MEALTKTHSITLYNDDKLSFDYVIAVLTIHCKHTLTQAEQCALQVHNKGKCDIVSGEFMEMFELKSKLDLLALKTELSSYESNLH
jgi:ATP-dependent Clp protease adaptor protein ClpS